MKGEDGINLFFPYLFPVVFFFFRVSIILGCGWTGTVHALLAVSFALSTSLYVQDYYLIERRTNL